MLKNAIYSSVNVFSNKLLIEDNIFKTAILRSEPREGLAVFRLKAVPWFLRYFKILSIGPVPGMEPAISRSVVKYFTDWANEKLVLIINNSFIVGKFSLLQEKKWKAYLNFFNNSCHGWWFLGPGRQGFCCFVKVSNIKCIHLKKDKKSSLTIKA